jgi:acyl-CoA thioesterase
MTPFSSLIASIESTSGQHRVIAPDDWRQGRTLYGGISAALCLEAILRDYPDLPPLRSIQIAFVGPSLGEARLQTRLLRQGKSAAFVACDLEGDGQVATRGLFCFGSERVTEGVLHADPAPDLPAPDACTDFFNAPSRPVFAQHFDMQMATGPRPLSGAPTSEISFWARHRDGEAKAGPVKLLALADAAPPAAMSMLTQVSAISSMTWTLDVLAPDLMEQDGWWLFRSTAETNGNGYSAQFMAIWDRQGRPVALGRQTVAIFPAS